MEQNVYIIWPWKEVSKRSFPLHEVLTNLAKDFDYTIRLSLGQNDIYIFAEPKANLQN